MKHTIEFEIDSIDLKSLLDILYEKSTDIKFEAYMSGEYKELQQILFNESEYIQSLANKIKKGIKIIK